MTLATGGKADDFLDAYTANRRDCVARSLGASPTPQRSHRGTAAAREFETGEPRQVRGAQPRIRSVLGEDAGVWADLALILWAAGLRVTAAWTIATETESALKEGNDVQGTVLMVLRKQTSDDRAFRTRTIG